MFRPIPVVLAAGLVLASPTAGAAEARGNAFNPKISLILDGLYADYGSRAPADVAGVLLGPETDPAPAGLSLGETELVVESNVDDQFHGWASLALANDNGETVVELEEAYVDTLALPAGLSLKAGRFFSDLGYQNRVHGHAWDFVDLPLAYRALLAGQLNDDGLQLRWVAPTDLFLEVGGEALRGAQFPGGGEDRSGARGFLLFTHLGGDLGTSHSWRLGFSHLATGANARRSGEEVPVEFSGDSDVRVIDLVWKWAPQGNPAQRNFTFNAEFFVRDENGLLTANPDGDADVDGDGNPDPAHATGYDGRQKALYAQGVWQFMPRWRVGLRYDRLEADNALAVGPLGELAALADRSYVPQRYSLMGDFSNSEFSRVRLQYTRDETRPGGEADDQFYLQYVMSLGSHPAHQF